MAGLTVGFGSTLLVVVGPVFLATMGHPNVAVGLLDAGAASLIGLILKMGFGCYRYFKNPPIRRMKNPQLEPNPSILILEGQDAATGGFYGATEAAS